jgi:outer membrane biosynthesis protein TonB
MKQPRCLRSSLIVLTAIVAVVGAQASADEPVKVDVFKGPKIVNRPLPQYPMGQRLDGIEGWTHVNFMVDKAGRPYEVTVVESSGDEIFDKLAVTTVE